MRRLNFHKILSGCEQGNRQAWRAFVADYTPIILRLLETYIPQWPSAMRSNHWEQVLCALTAGNFERLRSLDHQAEREFLMDMRWLAFQLAAEKLQAEEGQPGVPPPTLDSLGALLRNLPLAHQEIVFLKLGGYSDLTIERMLLIPSSLVQKAAARLAAEYGGILNRSEDACPWPSAWLEVLRRAQELRRPECPERRIYVRILDGQTSWYDKNPAEEHMRHCLHCLELWTALREVTYLRRVEKPLMRREVDKLISARPPGTLAEAGRSWVRHLWSR